MQHASGGHFNATSVLTSVFMRVSVASASCRGIFFLRFPPCRTKTGFNNGSVYMYINGNPTPEPGALAGAVSAEVVQRTSMNTALGGAAAGLTSLLCAAIFWGECRVGGE